MNKDAWVLIYCYCVSSLQFEGGVNAKTPAAHLMEALKYVSVQKHAELQTRLLRHDKNSFLLLGVLKFYSFFTTFGSTFILY